jgi:hypothetical protein
VGVVVVEPRQQRPPRQVDDASLRSHLSPYFVGSSDARDAVAHDGHGLRGRFGIVDGDNRSVQKNEIGGHGSSRALGFGLWAIGYGLWGYIVLAVLPARSP